MKNFFRQILVLIYAIHFLIAGSGYNLVRYCCDGCAHEGIEAVANKSCETIHHENEHTGNSCCNHGSSSHQSDGKDIVCSDTNHQTEGCHLWRLQTDIPSLSDTAVAEFVDFGVAVDLPYIVLSLFSGYHFSTEQSAFFPPDNIPLHSGRDILTYHAVLLI